MRLCLHFEFSSEFEVIMVFILGKFQANSPQLILIPVYAEAEESSTLMIVQKQSTKFWINSTNQKHKI